MQAKIQSLPHKIDINGDIWYDKTLIFINTNFITAVEDAMRASVATMLRAFMMISATTHRLEGQARFHRITVVDFTCWGAATY